MFCSSWYQHSLSSLLLAPHRRHGGSIGRFLLQSTTVEGLTVWLLNVPPEAQQIFVRSIWLAEMPWTERLHGIGMTCDLTVIFNRNSIHNDLTHRNKIFSDGYITKKFHVDRSSFDRWPLKYEAHGSPTNIFRIRRSYILKSSYVELYQSRNVTCRNQ